MQFRLRTACLTVPNQINSISNGFHSPPFLLYQYDSFIHLYARYIPFFQMIKKKSYFNKRFPPPQLRTQWRVSPLTPYWKYFDNKFATYWTFEYRLSKMDNMIPPFLNNNNNDNIDNNNNNYNNNDKTITDSFFKHCLKIINNNNNDNMTWYLENLPFICPQNLPKHYSGTPLLHSNML